MRWLDAITDSMDMILSLLQEEVEGKPGVLQFMGLQRAGHEQLNKNSKTLATSSQSLLLLSGLYRIVFCLLSFLSFIVPIFA